jgi:uncharacterized protein
MPAKHADKRSDRKLKSRKLGISQWIIIFISVIIALSFLLFTVYSPMKKKASGSKTLAHSDSGPAFRKDGTLSISLLKKTSTVNLDIEVADNEPERMRGLMDRFNLPEQAGMLFVFPDEDLRSFWMKNTYISLDIIYINKNKEIVSIQKYTQPQTTGAIPSEKPAMYVLEVNAGLADNYGINPGDKIEFKY